jgi:hypothetical protein
MLGKINLPLFFLKKGRSLIIFWDVPLVRAPVVPHPRDLFLSTSINYFGDGIPSKYLENFSSIGYQ